MASERLALGGRLLRGGVETAYGNGPILSADRAILPAVNDDALKLAVTNAEAITQWALLVVGGTVAILVGSEFRRPKSATVRWCFTLFVPGWLALLRSMYVGSLVSRAYIGRLSGVSDAATATRLINDNWYLQIWWFGLAMAVLGAWLVVYLLWWITHEEDSSAAETGKAA